MQCIRTFFSLLLLIPPLVTHADNGQHVGRMHWRLEGPAQDAYSLTVDGGKENPERDGMGPA